MGRLMRYPLPALTRHWPAHLREVVEEKASIIEADCSCSREEANELAEAVVRAQWLSGAIPDPTRRNGP